MVSSWWTYSRICLYIYSVILHTVICSQINYTIIYLIMHLKICLLWCRHHTKDIRMTARERTLGLTELSLGENTNSNLISSVQKPMVLGSMPCKFKPNHVLFLWNMKREYERSHSLHSLSLGVLTLFLKKKKRIWNQDFKMRLRSTTKMRAQVFILFSRTELGTRGKTCSWILTEERWSISIIKQWSCPRIRNV